MQRNLFNFTFCIFLLALALTSCSRNSHVEFSGRYHPNTKIDKSTPVVVSELPHSGEISKMPGVNPDEVYLASSNEAAEIAALQIINNVGNSYQPAISASERNTIMQADKRAIKKAAKSFAWNGLTDQSTEKSKMRKAFFHAPASEEKLLYCLLAIFLPPLAVALWEDGITINFWLDILFTLLFWIPGIIFAWIVII